MRIRAASSPSDLSGMWPLVKSYTEQLHPANPNEAGAKLLDEMLHTLNSSSHTLLQLVDESTGDVVGFIFGSEVDNYGEKVMFVIAVYSAVFKGGSELFEQLCSIAKVVGCKKVTGLVKWDRWQGHASVWKAVPEKVWLERSL